MKALLSSAAALVCLQCATPASATVGVTGDPVLYWNEVLIANLGGDPTVASRGFAMTDVALHDAVNATLGSPNHAYLGPVATPGGDTRAAASVAAHNVLVQVDPGHASAYDAALAASLALVPAGPAKTRGVATGAAIAAAAIANRASDGAFASVPYTPTGAPGHWQPTPPVFIPAVDAQWATVTPWLMSSPSQFRPAPPPALGSAEYTAAFNEVKAIGSATSATRTADQTFSAQFWAADEGDGAWLRAAIDESVATGRSTLDDASLFARLATGIGDAVIAAFDSKYTYDYWRPVTAIQLADTDGNPATTADPNWEPLLFTPPFPSYASAHSFVAGAAASILDQAFGDNVGFCLTDGVGNRCWASFDAAAADAANSRLWGGIHWSFDTQTGLATGYEIGKFDASQLAFRAVPEASTWVVLLVGFGSVGAAIRRRRRIQAAMSRPAQIAPVSRQRLTASTELA